MVKTALKYLIKVIAAAYFGLLIMVLVTIPLRLVTSHMVTQSVVSCILCVVGSMACLFFVCIKDGYDEKPEQKTPMVKTVIFMTIAVVIYDLLTVIFQYYTGAATNVCDLAQVFGNLDSTTGIKDMAREHGGLMFASLVIQTIPFIPAMMAGYLFGCKKREKSRKELIEK